MWLVCLFHVGTPKCCSLPTFVDRFAEAYIRAHQHVQISCSLQQVRHARLSSKHHAVAMNVFDPMKSPVYVQTGPFHKGCVRRARQHARLLGFRKRSNDAGCYPHNIQNVLPRNVTLWSCRRALDFACYLSGFSATQSSATSRSL